MTEIYIFRHGETDWNVNGLAQGHSDIPLNNTGKQQAQQLASKLRESKIQAILSSDLSRAVETAKFVAEILRVPIITTPHLREISLGEAEGTTIEESRAKYGEDLVRRMRTVKPEDMHLSYPDGESKAILIDRTHRAIHEFVRSNTYACIGVSTHGGVVQQLAHACMTEQRDPIHISNCAVYQFRFDRHLDNIAFCGEFSAAIASPEATNSTLILSGSSKNKPT